MKTKFGMSEAQTDRMDVWCREHAYNDQVITWLKTNPPPGSWEGTPMEWAYSEMPVFSCRDYFGG